MSNSKTKGLILFFHLRQDLTIESLSFRLSKHDSESIYPLQQVTHVPAHLILIDFITYTIYDVEKNPQF
jgi:hypothetical protein